MEQAEEETKIKMKDDGFELCTDCLTQSGECSARVDQSQSQRAALALSARFDPVKTNKTHIRQLRGSSKLACCRREGRDCSFAQLACSAALEPRPQALSAKLSEVPDVRN